MTREEAKQWLPILQAYSEGKVIQYKGSNAISWVDCNLNISQSDLTFHDKVFHYRIKPSEPSYRLFKYEEVPIGSEFRRKDGLYRGIIVGVSPDGTVWSSATRGMSLSSAFDLWELKKNGGWGPFGILEE